MANFIRNPIRRIKTVAREARDVITAFGTSQSAKQDYESGNPADRAVTRANVNRADKNFDRQLAEVARAVLKGKSGTSSDILNKYTKYRKGNKR
jgi:hypothetical protein